MDDEFQTNFGATRCSIWELALVCTGCHREMGITGEGVTVGDWGPNTTNIFANCATCSWETLTMLSPQLVAGKHSFFWDHESEDIRTILKGI